jgi:uncharacterized protein (DUF1697 family)
MSVVISMLRGVNVGGHNKIKMDALRALYSGLELRDPQTYIQSGNVIFSTDEQDLASVAERIKDGIERTFGCRPEVILRTASALKKVIARNPFATRPGVETSKLVVVFYSGNPDAEARKAVLRIKVDPEELRIDGRELYVYFPNGQARTKFPAALIEKTLKTPGTGRNWNTVTKLLEIANGHSS